LSPSFYSTVVSTYANGMRGVVVLKCFAAKAYSGAKALQCPHWLFKIPNTKGHLVIVKYWKMVGWKEM